MATQSLYRRYRPRTFAELKGQEHVVRALRTAVQEGREGQAYLFSGPRGTGKTTTARVLAKVLNCENPADGEPCCECDSCLAVERGTSYDVHELDAASNNGVDAMRDLIEKASLGTPGRHKVYILDEVHMLSKGAEAALLKTLEEPPPHVVFVLATTDPQKMSDTVISRTQHLQFHLLPADTLDEHVRWVAADAGLAVTDEAIDQVLARGAGSARDTLSALELVANSGGAASESVALEEFAESLVERDPGRALTMVARAVGLGRDPRTITEELIGFLRNGFLSLMAPDLVQLPSQKLAALTELARRVGPAGLVRGIETLGAALNEMRHAPDPRVLLDVAIVQLTSDAAATDVDALASRIAALEQQIAQSDRSPTPRPSADEGASSTRPPADPDTGRARLGGRAERAAATAPVATPEPAAAPSEVPPVADAVPAEPEVPPAASEVSPAAAPTPAAASAVGEGDWEAVKAGLRGIGRALFAPSTFVESGQGSLTVALPNESHRAKCEEHRAGIETALQEHTGGEVSLRLVIAGDGGAPADDGRSDGPAPSAAAPPGAVAGAGATGRSPRGNAGHDGRGADGGGSRASAASPLAPAEAPDVAPLTTPPPALHAVPDAVAGRAIAEAARLNGPEIDSDEQVAPDLSALPSDHEVDLEDLVDAPPETVKSPIDRLAEAFPGSELIDDID